MFIKGYKIKRLRKGPFLLFHVKLFCKTRMYKIFIKKIEDVIELIHNLEGIFVTANLDD